MNHKLKFATLARNSVGKVMTSKVPTINRGKTVGEVIELLPKLAKKMDSINYLYVLSETNKLRGVVSIKELIQQSPETKISDIMIRKPVVSRPQVRKERAAHLAIKHNLKAIPVVDKNNHLLGILSSD